MRKINFQADIRSDALAFVVVANFIEPEVASRDGTKSGINQLRRSLVKKLLIHIKATLRPRQLLPGNVDKFHGIRMRIVQMQDHSPIFV